MAPLDVDKVLAELDLNEKIDLLSGRLNISVRCSLADKRHETRH